jgi:transposase
MQGKKDFTPKMLYQVHLGNLVPQDNFYRLLDKALDLRFLYKATEQYYGTEGQESIDPVVFFKICLVGYLHNINSDRRLIEYCSDSLAVRLFLKYDLDESLPWHSTISRTRQLYGEEVFLDLFRRVLSMCVEKGMVSGRRQAVDSAFIKANASMDSLIEKEVIEDAGVYADELNRYSEYKVTAHKKHEVEQRHKRRAKETEGTPGSDYKEGKEGDGGEYIQSKFLSNDTHYSPTDPDARISTKSGKPRNLNYSGQLSVDTAHHVITGALSSLSDKRDSQCLSDILGQTNENLNAHGMRIEQLLGDSGYSSGEALNYCEENNIDAYIPNFGQYKPEREGFVYNRELDQYECQRGNRAILAFKGIRTKHRYDYQQKEYRSRETDCRNCPLRVQCCGEKSKYKRLSDNIHKECYDRMHRKLTDKKAYAQRMFRLRSSTVEPVLGTLINFLNMKRVNTRGIQLANKHVLMAALTYNLKKYMKFTGKRAVSQAIAIRVKVENVGYDCLAVLGLILLPIKTLIFDVENAKHKNNLPVEWQF